MTTPAVIFLHIPKTAGLTLRQIIRRQFPAGSVYAARHPGERARLIAHVQGTADAPSSSATDLNERHLARLSEVADPSVLRAYVGHFWYGVHEHLPPPTTYITLLRDPLERALSLYHHSTLRHGLTLGVDQWIHEARDRELHNPQTRRLAGSSPNLRDATCTDATLAAAKDHLATRFAAVGVTERFDEFLLLLRHTFGWRRLHYVALNRSVERPRVPDLDPEVATRLAELNSYDLQLHAFAETLFAEQAAAVDPAELRTFQRRNRIFSRLGAPATRWRAVRARRYMTARSG